MLDNVLSKLKRVVFDLLASSIREHVFINEWLLDKKQSIRLPYLKKLGGTSEKHVFETLVNVPKNKLSWIMKFVINCNGLVRLNEDLWHGIDEAHTYTIIPPGRHRITLVVYPKKLLGTSDPYILFENSILMGILWKPFALSLRVLNLIDYLKHLPEDSGLRRRLVEKLYDVLLKIKSKPNIKQLYLATTLLHRQNLFKREIPGFPTDYVFLVGIYSVDLMNNLYRDLPMVPEEVVLSDAEYLEQELDTTMNDLRREYPKKGLIYICGHSHIDAAWLWDFNDTVEKLKRTFSTVARLIETYDDMVFIQSSAQYYKWIEETESKLFNKIRELVNKGKWVIVGGTWVECDLQLITGESIARQFLYGQRYFLEKFGRQARIGWFPDSFGFPASLPQILRKSGIEVFVTHKVMWNRVNRFPHHSFIWKGLDGTEIPTQIIVTNYNEAITPINIARCWREYIDKDRVGFTILSYGYGDGGGGPTIEMIENIKLVNQMPDLPELRHLNEDEYINMINKSVENMVEWNDELYLEMHRGTYTTNTVIKEYMYRAESLIRSLEVLMTIADKLHVRNYPKNKIDLMWEKILLHQFHDVLPGSSIKKVYDKTIKDLEEVLDNAKSLMSQVLDMLADGDGVIVFNDLPWQRSSIIEFNEENLCLVDTTNNTVLECQYANGKSYVYVPGIPPMGFRVFKIVKGKGRCRARDEEITFVKAYIVREEEEDNFVIENNVLKVTINGDGELVSIFDKEAKREYIRSPSNVIKAHPDRPGIFDAWEVDDDFMYFDKELATISKPVITLKGPLIACIEFKKKFNNSILTQRICLRKSSRVIDFRTHVKWVDKLVLVKTWFDFNLDSSRAFFETPYGVVARSTKLKTRWEKARFEVPALRWVDLSDGRHGVTLISPSRHGYSIHGSKVGLSLLKSPLFPNPWSDLGEYSFSYHIYVHKGSWEEGDVVKTALELWSPLKTYYRAHTKPVEQEKKPPYLARKYKSYSLLRIEPSTNIEVGCLKKSEDCAGYVLRICNLDSRRKMIRIFFHGKVEAVVETDILEKKILRNISKQYIKHKDETIVEVDLKPFEIKTLKLITS